MNKRYTVRGVKGKNGAVECAKLCPGVQKQYPVLLPKIVSPVQSGPKECAGVNTSCGARNNLQYDNTFLKVKNSHY